MWVSRNPICSLVNDSTLLLNNKSKFKIKTPFYIFHLCGKLNISIDKIIKIVYYANIKLLWPFFKVWTYVPIATFFIFLSRTSFSSITKVVLFLLIFNLAQKGNTFGKSFLSLDLFPLLLLIITPPYLYFQWILFTALRRIE